MENIKSSLAAIFVLILGVGFNSIIGCGVSSKSTVLKYSKSPDGKREAKIISNDVNATTTSVERLVICDNESKESLLLLSSPSILDCMFRFSWKDSSHLTIEMPDYYEKEIKKIGEWHGVTVEYVSKRPNVLRETNSPDGKFRALLYDLGCGGGRVVLIRGVNEDIGNPIIGENGKNAHVGWIKDGMKVNFQWLGKKVLKITTNESVNNVVAPKTEYMEIRVEWVSGLKMK